MSKFDTIVRSVAAIACTVVFSTACVLGAVAPAHVASTPITESVAVSPLA